MFDLRNNLKHSIEKFSNRTLSSELNRLIDGHKFRIVRKSDNSAVKVITVLNSGIISMEDAREKLLETYLKFW